MKFYEGEIDNPTETPDFLGGGLKNFHIGAWRISGKGVTKKCQSGFGCSKIEFDRFGQFSHEL